MTSIKDIYHAAAQYLQLFPDHPNRSGLSMLWYSAIEKGTHEIRPPKTVMAYLVTKTYCIHTVVSQFFSCSGRHKLYDQVAAVFQLAIHSKLVLQKVDRYT